MSAKSCLKNCQLQESSLLILFCVVSKFSQNFDLCNTIEMRLGWLHWLSIFLMGIISWHTIGLWHKCQWNYSEHLSQHFRWDFKGQPSVIVKWFRVTITLFRWISHCNQPTAQWLYWQKLVQCLSLNSKVFFDIDKDKHFASQWKLWSKDIEISKVYSQWYR